MLDKTLYHLIYAPYSTHGERSVITVSLWNFIAFMINFELWWFTFPGMYRPNQNNNVDWFNWSYHRWNIFWFVKCKNLILLFFTFRHCGIVRYCQVRLLQPMRNGSSLMQSHVQITSAIVGFQPMRHLKWLQMAVLWCKVTILVTWGKI